MATTAEPKRRNLPDNSVLAAIVRVLYAIRGSFTVFIFALGVVWLLLGLALQSGVIAGMLVIWGVSAMIFAGIARIGFRLIGYSS
jgi:hypothetical protein